MTDRTKIEPLPFRLRIPGKDILDSRGIRSISYRLEGLLHITGGILILEWAATETVERVSVTGVRTDVDRSPIGRIEIPAASIARVWLRGGWLMPRLVFRARRLDAFDGFPTTRRGVITLKIRRRDRKQAAAMVEAIELARMASSSVEIENPSPLGQPKVRRLGEGDS